MKSKNPFSHKIKLNLTKKNDNFLDWLMQQHGPGGVQAGSKWYIHRQTEIDYGSDVTVCFRDSRDAAMFALHWL